LSRAALWLDRDGSGSLFDFTDDFAVAEIEVWDSPDTSSTQQPGAQTCATLGP
jgi:hypothetical protein